MTTEIPVDPTNALQSQFNDLMDNFVILKSSNEKNVRDLSDLHDKYVTDMSNKQSTIDSLQQAISSTNSSLLAANNQINQLSTQIKDQNALQEQIDVLEKDIKHMEMLNPLSRYTKWQLIKYLLFKR